VTLRPESRIVNQVDEHAAPSMNTSHNIVCISTIDWDFIWQGHQEIMSTLARQGHRILFIENTGVRRVALKDLPRLRHRLKNWRRGISGIRKVMDNLYVYAPLVLPFPYSRLAQTINKLLMFWILRRWTRSMRFDNPVIWTWLPTPLALALIRFLDGQLIIYYCCDNFEASSPGSRRIRKSEDTLLRKADLVFAHSKTLFDRCKQHANDVHVFRYGFNREVFSHAGETPPDLLSIPRPILGYVGGFHRHVDQDLMLDVAKSHPDKSLVFVGPLQVEVGELRSLPNVFFLGQKPHELLPSYIKYFDVALIPYRLNDYTRSVYPTKLNEYLAMGKPVISTKLPEIEYFNQCHRSVVSLAETSEAFVGQIQIELDRDNDAQRAFRIGQVAQNAWGEKIESMQRLIRAKLEEKAKTRELNWQNLLVRVYRASRRQVVGLAIASLLGYALLFHSPLIWKIGEPLRIVDEPARADAIVVLAAGVGELGESGYAYREKVKYAVDLYKQGFAEHMIFSSGESFVFREAQVMKALAVALGVPETAILLDEVGGGHYTSLLHVKQLMQDMGWSRMLLVTSWYNTGRSHLVAQKNLPQLVIRLTPAPESAFFGGQKRVEWKHIRAITHEYLAIVYYWVRGYI
jgi:glycosyltransferase involved in cell wall biosynthesis/uncharacterized SAM-binding protein YcdF (DUF218 family)